MQDQILIYTGIVYDCDTFFSIAVGGIGGATSIDYSENGIINGLNECVSLFLSEDGQSVENKNLDPPPHAAAFIDIQKEGNNIDAPYGYTQTHVTIKPDGRFTLKTIFISAGDFDSENPVFSS